MDNQKVAKELLKLAKEMMSEQVRSRRHMVVRDIIDMDADDAIEAILEKLERRVNANEWEFVRDNEWVMRWYLGEDEDLILAEFSVNPRNQPIEDDVMKIGLVITDNGMTLEDGVWSFKSGHSVNDAVRTLEIPIKKALRNRNI